MTVMLDFLHEGHRYVVTDSVISARGIDHTMSAYERAIMTEVTDPAHHDQLPEVWAQHIIERLMIAGVLVQTDDGDLVPAADLDQARQEAAAAAEHRRDVSTPSRYI
ncbi:MAG: hypothetical protein RLZZ598_1838 [Pseudomonadota bacterium]